MIVAGSSGGGFDLGSPELICDYETGFLADIGSCHQFWLWGAPDR